MYIFLLNGVQVFVTDYIGLNTPGIPPTSTHLPRPGTRCSTAPAQPSTPAVRRKDSPVGFVGYSPGGGAAASAAELAPDVRT